MTKRIIQAGLTALLLCTTSFAQTAPPAGGQPQQPPTWDVAALRSFNAVHDKLIAMCKDSKFPADKEGYKPHPDSRSYMEELQHATVALLAGIERMKGSQPNNQQIQASLPKDRASLVPVMEKAKADWIALWEKDKHPRIIGTTEHAGEHYGKLVTIYRVNGVVPPGSRRDE